MNFQQSFRYTISTLVLISLAGCSGGATLRSTAGGGAVNNGADANGGGNGNGGNSNGGGNPMSGSFTSFAYPASGIGFTYLPVGTAISPMVPSVSCSGGVACCADQGCTYTASSSMPLPSGLTIDRSTGIISGTPSQRVASQDCQIQVSSPIGSATVTLTVLTDQTFSYVSQDAYLAGQAMNPLGPTVALPGGYSRWTVSGTLPNGLSLNPSSGVITGTPALTGSGAGALSYRKSIVTATHPLYGTRSYPLYFRVVPRLMASGQHEVCVTQGNGALYCWAKPSGVNGNPVTLDPSQATSTLQDNVASITLGAGMVCALTSRGFVQCFNENSGSWTAPVFTSSSDLSSIMPQPIPTTGVGPAGALVGNEDGICAVLQSGSVTCWTAPNPTQNQQALISVPGNLGVVSALSMGQSYVFAMTSRGVQCWGGDGHCSNWLPSSMGANVAAVAENTDSLGEICFMYKDATTACYTKQGGQLTISPNSGSNYAYTVQKMVSSDLSRCALMLNSGGNEILSCRASNSESAGGTITEALSLPTNQFNSGGTLTSDSRGLIPVISDISTSVVRNSSGYPLYLTQCALKSDRVVCWNNYISTGGNLWAQSDLNTFGPLELAMTYNVPNWVSNSQIQWNSACTSFYGRPRASGVGSNYNFSIPGDALARMNLVAGRNAYYYSGAGPSLLSTPVNSMPSLSMQNSCSGFLERPAACLGKLPGSGAAYEVSYGTFGSSGSSSPNAWFYQNECQSFQTVNGSEPTFNDYLGQLRLSLTQSQVKTKECSDNDGAEFVVAAGMTAGHYLRMCRLSGGGCPSSLSQTSGWSTTQQNCNSCPPGCGQGCSGFHAWGPNMNIEHFQSCVPGVVGCGNEDATRTEIGCWM